ncbi:hypothetical protein Tco_0907877 [Tanacetum coccineum]|uniref:Reverse transcriptase domain-containing protein n=1 Tax=Tanacetum coccineum TaxID=301880 RepID=A0ABQ5CNC1_9ASTR
MAGPTEGGGPEGQDDREVTPPLTKEQIEGHVSALRSLIKDHNRKNKTYPIRLDFDEEDVATKDTRIVKGKEVVDDDLRKPFKEVLKTPLTRRIIEFTGPEYKMPTNIKLYDGNTDPEDHLGRFASAANSGEWPMPADLREAFTTRYSVRKACFKEPHEITKIIRRANESLSAFKERWTVETGFIMGVPEIMKISSFMDSLKCPELAKRFSDKAPATVNEMMKRLDDFVRSEKAFAQTELPKGETGEQHRKSYFPPTRRDDHPIRNHQTDHRRFKHRNNYRGRDNALPYRGRDYRPPHPPTRGDHQARVTLVLTLYSLTKYPKEILATETQLRLIPPRPMMHPQRGGNMDRFYDYHQEKGVRSLKDKKRKAREATEKWMNAPITFPPVSTKDVSDEPLIVEPKVEEYLVRMIYVDGGASVEVIEGLCRRTTMKFTVIRSPSPYNVILGRTGLKALRVIPSTIHSMMKFPTPRGIATLVTRSVIISECQRPTDHHRRGIAQHMQRSVKAFIERQHGRIRLGTRKYDKSSPKDYRTPSECQHIRRVLAPEKSKSMTRDVEEWVKAGIV